MSSSTETGGASADFTTTQWSVVLDARHTDPVRAQAALERLCRRYWYPLYAFVRRSGQTAHDAEDTTQGFFAHLLGKNALKRVGQDKGRFRTFLLTSLVNFMNDERDRQGAAKRGGKNQVLSWDALAAEEAYRHEPVDSFTPETLFERRWAFTLVQQVLARLRKECENDGKKELFDKLDPCLTGRIPSGLYAEMSARFGMSQGSVRVLVHRLRRHLGQLLRSEIAHTVARPDEVEAELRYLFRIVGS